jgi:hypothetical protein
MEQQAMTVTVKIRRGSRFTKDLSLAIFELDSASFELSFY